MKTKKSNIWLAFLLSLLTALAGSIIFGAIYGLGYYIYILATLEIILSCSVFFKFKQASNWKIVLLAIAWSLICTFIFNFIAILVCEAIWIAQEFQVTTAEAFNALMELWKSEPEIQAYMNTRLFQIAGMIFIGGVLYGVSYTVHYFKYKKLHGSTLQNPHPALTNQVANSTQTNLQPSTSLETLTKTYHGLINDCTKIYLIFLKDKNKEAFKIKLAKIEKLYVKPLNVKDKEIIKKNLQKRIDKQTISKEDKAIAKILLTLFN